MFVDKLEALQKLRLRSGHILEPSIKRSAILQYDTAITFQHYLYLQLTNTSITKKCLSHLMKSLLHLQLSS
jgi:hypothetical protein